ncbi:MAG: molybdopterin-dependent oxidoreductase [Acidimicrobiales bacterium]
MTTIADRQASLDTGTTEVRTAYRTCPLCEAGCGLEVTVREREIVRIRGDRSDVFSHGFICPKGSTLKQLHEDPDRLRIPLVRRNGVLEPATWDEAFAEVERRLPAIVAAHGPDAVAVYLGNPNVHNLAALLYGKPFIKALGTANVYTASTVDQRPKEVAAGLMFGHPTTVPVPDIDRTDHLLLLGANPFESNGSLATAPDWPGRLKALRARGGRLVVVDPRRTKTAEAADEHVAIRPGTDPYLLAAMINTLAADGRVDLAAASAHVERLDDLLSAVAPFTPEAVERVTGVDASTIRRLADDLRAAPSGCVYGRIGTTTAPFGTAASWLVDALNIVSGNLDRVGGAMFARPAAGAANTKGRPQFGRGALIGRRSSRVRGLPESFGELPAVCLAEEIETEGDGQIRALVAIAGNPVLSLPNGARLDRAIAGLDFMVSVDIYLNETSRHADVVLPPPSALQRSHYDIALLFFALRNVANYSEPTLPVEAGELDEWEILARLALIAAGMGAGADPDRVTDLVARTLLQSAAADEHGHVAGREVDELMDAVAGRRGPEKLLDIMLRVGPYGDGFGADPAGLTLAELEARPHGLDLGPLEPRLPECLRTPTGKIDLAPEPILVDLPRLAAGLADGDGDTNGGLVLVGRRDLRSNNSWMHNVNVLVKGNPRCTLHVHPSDAARLALATGTRARVTGRTGSVVVPVEVTDAVRPGVVSLPHGWGHDLDGSRLRVAAAHAGVNSNLLTDDERIDEISGTAAFTAVPVEVNAAADAPAG